MNAVLIHCLYAIIFIIRLYLIQNRLANKVLETSVITVAYIVIMFGFLNWLEQGKAASVRHETLCIEATTTRLADTSLRQG